MRANQKTLVIPHGDRILYAKALCLSVSVCVLAQKSDTPEKLSAENVHVFHILLLMSLSSSDYLAHNNFVGF